MSNMVSVIIPYVNEWPQVAFTIRSIAEELIDRVDFEIIAVDNWCGQMVLQGRKPDRGHHHINKKGKPAVSNIASMSQKYNWLTYIQYEEKLSHWNAKRKGVDVAQGDFLWFMDAHVVPRKNTLLEAYVLYVRNYKELNGALHLPLTYHILEDQRLIYRMKYNPDKGIYHYTFKNLDTISPPFVVPCMSTCGMLTTRHFYSLTGGWPRALGIYGGGENFMNYVSGVIGLKKWIYCGLGAVLHHHGDDRGYAYEYFDYEKNRALALYLAGGRARAMRYLENNVKASNRTKWKILEEIEIECETQRGFIKERQVFDLDEWCEKWKDTPYGRLDKDAR